jgi:ribonuclease-3
MIKFFFRKKKTNQLSSTFNSFLKNQLGIIPNNELWYKEAISHSSYKNISGEKVDNERLEFLGDAFISMVVTEYLFNKYPKKNEGYLTKVRSKIVSREQLNKFGNAIELEKHLLYQKGKNTYKSLVGNAFEALFGAILLDKGYRKAKESFEEYILTPYLDIRQLLKDNRDHKSDLLIYFQKKREQISFETKKTEDENGKIYFSSVIMKANHSIGRGKGSSKKSAEQDASKQVLSGL